MAAPSRYLYGSLSPTSGSEDTVFTAPIAGIYEVLIRLNNMTTGDIVTIRLYRSPEAGVAAYSSYLEKDWVLSNAQTYNLFTTDPKGVGFQDGSTNHMTVTLQQSSGTHRHFDYTILAY